MKTLELKLKKDVIIVDESYFDYYELFKDGIYLKLANGDRDYIEGNLELICKGSELTEEIASKLVQTTWIHDKKILCKYKNYNSEGDGSYFSAVKSFISAVESKEKFWLENPIEIIERGEDTEHNRVLNQNEWQEAEEKTFKNPLIFVKK